MSANQRIISIILAMDINRVIGKDNKLPWRLPAEMAYFKKATMGHAVIMGRKTYESIGKPLPGRDNIVITRDKSYKAEGCTVVHSITDVLERYKEGEIFVIGGAEIIREFLSVTDRLYITLIEHAFEGDTFFPEIDSEQWKLISREKGLKDEKNPYDYYFQVFERRHSS